MWKYAAMSSPSSEAVPLGAFGSTRSFADAVAPLIGEKRATGVIHFDSAQVQQEQIGRYVKRLLPVPPPKPGVGVGAATVSQRPPSSDDFTFGRLSELVMQPLNIAGRTWRLLANRWPFASHHSMLTRNEATAHNLTTDDVPALAEVLERFPDSEIVFQSFGAGGSVNDLHLHVVEGEDFPIQHAEERPLAVLRGGAGTVEVGHLADWPVPAFRLSVGPRQQRLLVNAVASIATELTERNIPHNVLMTSAGAVVAVRGRNPEVSYGIGAWEAFGIRKIAGDRSAYNEMDAASFEAQLLTETAISPGLFQVCENVIREQVREVVDSKLSVAPRSSNYINRG